MSVLARQWLEPEEIEFCRECATIEGLGSAEALIAWTPEVGIRSGDIVITEYECKVGRRRAYLKAERVAGLMVLRTRCGIPNFIVSPGTSFAFNGLTVLGIIGIVRGSYICF